MKKAIMGAANQERRPTDRRADLTRRSQHSAKLPANAANYIDPGKPVQNAFIESFMYGRPLRCKMRDKAGAGFGSGALMYAACSRGPSHDRWP